MPPKGYDFERQYITEISNKIERSIILYNVVVFKHGENHSHGDLAMANLGIIMGMHKCEVSFFDVIKGKADVKDVIYEKNDRNIFIIKL